MQPLVRTDGPANTLDELRNVLWLQVGDGPESPLGLDESRVKGSDPMRKSDCGGEVVSDAHPQHAGWCVEALTVVLGGGPFMGGFQVGGALCIPL